MRTYDAGKRRSKLRLYRGILAFLSDGLIEQIADDFNRRRGGFGNDPFDLARLDLVLCDAAGFARMCLDHRRRSTLQLPGTTRRDQNVPIIAIETVNQLHL